MSETVLITGATGFVGSHLARRLVESGADVHIIIRPGSSLGILGDAASRVRAHLHDGTTTGMVRILTEIRPDVVFHLASLFIASHRTEDVEGLVTSNVLFGAQLVEAMSVAGAGSLVNAGTSWQHFEDAAYRPVSLYAATKQAFEDIVRFYTDATSLRAISLHLFDTYGSGDPRPKLFHLLMKTAEAGQSLAMSPGEQLLDLVHVDDVVDAFLRAAERLKIGSDASFEVYAVSAGTTISLRDLVELFGKVRGSPLQIEWGGRPYRPREVMRPWSSGTPVPGWLPRVRLEDGIRRILRGD